MSTTKVSLQIPAGLGFEEWKSAGFRLAGVLSSSSWWLGDWLIYGRHHYSDRYELAIEAAGLQYQTLRNYAWVAGRFPPTRRRADLSFQHHAEVAAMSVDKQELWLHRAERNGWTVKQLRAAVRAPAVDGAPVSDLDDLRKLAVPRERVLRWREAAVQSGTDLSQWVMATLDSAAEEILAADR